MDWKDWYSRKYSKYVAALLWIIAYIITIPIRGLNIQVEGHLSIIIIGAIVVIILHKIIEVIVRKYILKR